MTSQINPNTIDGAYPVAGQDNNSQGFRDNFTNTRTNFAAAAAEITDLQNKVLLKAPLTGTAVADNNMNGTRLVGAQLQNTSLTVVNLQNVSGTRIINYVNGQYQYNANITGNTTFSFEGFPTLPTQTVMGFLYLRLNIDDISYTVSFTNTVDVSSLRGIQGVSGQTITFAQTGTYEFVFHSINGGSTLYLHELTRPRNYYTNPLFLDVPQLLAANGNVSTTTSTTVITSSAASLTGNLAVGSSGQIKIIAYGNASVGDATINVANAAWGGANTASFTNPGDTCTLQYINGQWFAIGNVGAVLS